MTFEPGSVDRRTVLKTAGVAGTAAVAGCTGLGDTGRDEDVVLPPPDDYDADLAEQFPHPTYGEEVPELSVPAPVVDEEVTTTQFLGDRHTLYTFLYTQCPDVCPGLMANLRHVQEDSLDEGYADEVALLPVTFDPEYDTASVLDEYEQDHGVDQEVGNWYSLRPETPEAAQEVVQEGFGVAFSKEDDSADHGDDGADGSGDHDGHGDDHGGHGDDHVTFAHTNLVLLVNAGGTVERAFFGNVPNPSNVIEATRAVVEGW